MKVLAEGYFYELKYSDDKDKAGQTLQFVRPEMIDEDTGEILTHLDGTTDEEILDVLIHRLIYTGGDYPCKENIHAITHLKEAFWWIQERRTRKS